MTWLQGAVIAALSFPLGFAYAYAMQALGLLHLLQ